MCGSSMVVNLFLMQVSITTKNLLQMHITQQNKSNRKCNIFVSAHFPAQAGNAMHILPS